MDEKPNLLLIMCDQLRADVLGCYGNKFVRTPNIDRLARQGVCFDNAYSQTPVCVPARYGLISGLNPFELGLTDNGRRTREIEHPLAGQIRNQRYFTCAVGKMHFTPVREHYGFDRMFLSEEIPGHLQDDDFLLFLREQGYGHIVEPHGKRSDTYYVPQVSELPEHLHTSAWTADLTCETIRKNRNRPFFLFTSFIKPHPPFDPCEPYHAMYPPDKVPMPVRQESEREPDDTSIDEQNDYKVNGIDSVSDDDVRKIRAHYYGLVSQVDAQIGKILDTLEEYGLSDNTLVIFTADHGEMLGDHYSFGKRTFYEPSARIPFIVRWPRRLPAGERRRQLVHLQDIYATLIDASGGEVPAASSGRSVLPACLNAQTSLRRRLIGEFGRGRRLKFMLRWDDYKYIYHANGAKEQLFHLIEDPFELTNLASQYPELCAQCRRELAMYYQSHGFDEALDGNDLRKFPYERHKPKGFLNQYPKWPSTVLE